MIGHTLSFIDATRNNRVPTFVQQFIDNMGDKELDSQWMARFAIRWIIRKGYIQESEIALAKFAREYGQGGSNWRYLRDLLDDAKQATQTQELAA